MQRWTVVEHELLPEWRNHPGALTPKLEKVVHTSRCVRRNVARAFLATPEKDSRRLAEFFTLSAGSVDCSGLPEALAKDPAAEAFYTYFGFQTLAGEHDRLLLPATALRG